MLDEPLGGSRSVRCCLDMPFTPRAGMCWRSPSPCPRSF